MGWTHYWRRDIDLPADKFVRAVADFRKIVKFLGIPLGDLHGVDQPVLNDEAILFNGSEKTGCEGFELRRHQSPRWSGRDQTSSYCKTDHMPYDICVQAALIVMKHHLEDAIMVSSDGKDEDWGKARNACQECLGYGDEFHLQRE
jgi:hypothetical protein